MLRFLSEFHISLVKQNHEVTKRKKNSRRRLRGNHFSFGSQFGLGLVPCFAPRAQPWFSGKGRDPKKNALHTPRIKAVPSHTGESESQVRQGLTKKSVMSSWLLNMAPPCLFISEKTRPFHKRFLQDFSCLLFVRLFLIYPKKCFHKYLPEV